MISNDTFRATAQAIRTNGLGNVVAYLATEMQKKSDIQKAAEAKAAYEQIGITIEEFLELQSREAMAKTLEVLKKLRFAELTSQQDGTTKLFKP